MSLLIGKPHLLYCPKCGWQFEQPIRSDCLPFSHCPKCEASLSLKEASLLDTLQLTVKQIFSRQ